jgi:Cu2+-exporting ATPase
MHRFCFSLPDIRCVNCTTRIEDSFASCQELAIQQFAIDLVSKKLSIVIDDERSKDAVRELLQQRLHDLGFSAHDLELPQTPVVPTTRKSWFKKKLQSHWLQGGIGLSLGFLLLFLSLFGALPWIAMLILACIAVPATLFLGGRSYFEALRELRWRNLTMDTLFALSTLTVIAISIAALFVPWLPMMFDAGLLIFGFRHLGLGIEESIQAKMARSLKFTDELPRTISYINKHGIVRRKFLSSVEVGDILVLKPGELIPVDGVCVGGGFVMDTVVTGSTIARAIKENEELLSGMKVADGPDLHLRVLAKATDSYLARLDKKMEFKQGEKSAIETATKRILQYFIPTVIALTVIAGITIACFFPVAIALQCAVAVLVSACPCTLGFITPLALKIGMHKAAQQGVVFKSTKTLQAAQQVDAVVFDLNGTLTEGEPKITEVKVFADAGLSEDDFFAYLALIERDSSHLVAQAIREHVRERGGKPPLDWVVEHITEDHAPGLSANINGEMCVIGNKTMMLSHGINDISLDEEGSSNMVYFARAGQVIGYLRWTDSLRVQAKQAVEALRRLGKKVYICTGAVKETAHYYAACLGIPNENVAADCVGAATKTSFSDKPSFIRKLKKQGLRVAMVGDAGNDALAVNKDVSHFSLALKSQGSHPITEQEAGAVIERPSLQAVVSAFEVSKQTVRHIQHSLMFSLSYNIAAVLLAGGLLLAIGMVLNPGVGVALMVVQTALILYSAYCFKKRKLEQTQAFDAIPQKTKTSYERVFDLCGQPSLEAQASCESPTSLALQSNSNRSGVANRMRLTHTDPKSVDESKLCFN